MKLLQIFKDSIFHSWLIASGKHVIKGKVSVFDSYLVVIESIQELFSYESLKRASIEYGG